MQDIGVPLENISCPIAMVGIGIQDGKPVSSIAFPEVVNGNGHIVEAAVSAEKVPPGMVPPGSDEGKGPIDFPKANLLRRLHHASHGGPSGASERVRLHLRDQIGGVDLKNERVRDLGTAVEAEPIIPQKVIERSGEIGQPPTDGQVAPPAEAFMIQYAHPRSVHGLGFMAQGYGTKAYP
jgi:hypothetical protein